jgi:glycosyltransferase involved in cell wall biosynthesis
VTCALAFGGDETEVVVSNNDLTGKTTDALSSMKQRNFRVVTPPRRLSMTDHFNFAIDQSRGQYVLLLGDDDGLVPHSSKVVCEKLAASDADVATAEQHIYLWPTDNRDGGIWHLARPCTPTGLDAADIARQALRWGGARWERAPSIYRSFIRRDVLVEVKRRIGLYTKTIIPDMYMGFALAGLGVKCINPGWPFSISGMSYEPRKMPKITSTHNDVDGSFSQHMKEHDSIVLDTELPAGFPRIINAFADTMRTAIRDFPDNYRGMTLDMSVHYAWMASWGSIGTLRDFWRVRPELKGLGFNYPKFLLVYSMFRAQHYLSATRAQRAAKLMAAADIVEASNVIRSRLDGNHAHTAVK